MTQAEIKIMLELLKDNLEIQLMVKGVNDTQVKFLSINNFADLIEDNENSNQLKNVKLSLQSALIICTTKNIGNNLYEVVRDACIDKIFELKEKKEQTEQINL